MLYKDCLDTIPTDLYPFYNNRYFTDFFFLIETWLLVDFLFNSQSVMIAIVTH